jgi:flavodoxin
MWPVEGYSFDASAAVEGDHFVGLALDDDNEAAQTPQRISAWVKQLIGEFGL